VRHCNRYVKFDALLSKARSLGADYLATGHYCRVEFNEDRRRWTLRRAMDCARTRHSALSLHAGRARPHADAAGPRWSKAETRAIATELGLLVSNKPDSQEICFVQGGSYTDFLAATARRPSGPAKIVDTSGRRRGKHDGIAFYTIGQRRPRSTSVRQYRFTSSISMLRQYCRGGNNDELLADGLIAYDLNWVGIGGLNVL